MLCKLVKRKSQSIDKHCFAILGCDPGGARTHDPMIKSHLLYQLSHGVIFCVCECKVKSFLPKWQILKPIFSIDEVMSAKLNIKESLIKELYKNRKIELIAYNYE